MPLTTRHPNTVRVYVRDDVTANLLGHFDPDELDDLLISLKSHGVYSDAIGDTVDQCFGQFEIGDDGYCDYIITVTS